MIDQRSQEIHERAVKRAKNHLKSESELTDSLEEVERYKTYQKFDRTSLYQYAIDFLFLSEDRALTLIAIMRKSKSVPELKEAVRSGAITASKAKKIVPVLTVENKQAWLELASTSTSRAIEKAVALENPKLATKESLKYKTDERLELVIGVSEEWEKLLQLVQDLASQKTGKAVSREEALKFAMQCYVEKHDPLEKAKRARERLVRKPIAQMSNVSPVPGPITRKPLNATLKHAVMWRDERRCTHESRTGETCQERRWLDVHHRMPVSRGGLDHLENLTTLCRAHHTMTHHQR